MVMVMAKVLAFLLLLLAASAATTLTLHNDCPYPVWPLITPNVGFSSFCDHAIRLDAGGRGRASFTFPPSFWAGRVVARTVCDVAASLCETGTSPPFTVAQLSVHAEGVGHAAYSVSLVDGFNVPMVISPQAGSSGQCPTLGCSADLNRDCPSTRCVRSAGGDVVACKGSASYFKDRCPYTRTTQSDREPVPQRCFEPGEIKIVFCPPAMVGGEGPGEDEREVIRTVVADN